VAEGEADRIGKGSAADLLSRWRAAERDHAAAVESASVAELAAATAERAAHAARETAAAARLSLEAAQRADRAARETAEAADSLGRAAARDHETATAAVVDSIAREAAAREAFHDAEKTGFAKPKDTGR
jgi:hypothetical protein